MNKMSGKFNKVCFVLKQTACEEVIQLKKRYLDARRKRRNFSKTSTEILNEYFLANINHPYPSEEVKQALAMQCNISVAQVKLKIQNYILKNMHKKLLKNITICMKIILIRPKLKAR